MLRSGVDVGAHALGALPRRAGEAVALDRVGRELGRVAAGEVAPHLLDRPADARGQDDGADQPAPAGVGARLREPALEPLRRHPDRNPAVAERPRTADRGVRASADPERRSAAAGRPRLDRDPLEAKEATRERRPRAAEQRPQGEHRLVGARAPLPDRHADGSEILLASPPDTHAQDDASTREVVERGELARYERRVRSGSRRTPAPSVIRSVTAAKLESATMTSSSGWWNDTWSPAQSDAKPASSASFATRR